MGSIKTKLDELFKRRLFKFGVPFIILVFGGSLGLREFTQLRYQYRNVKQFEREEVEKLGIEMKKPGEVTLESEYEKIKNVDIDNWEQIRGPRPWEEKN